MDDIVYVLMNEAMPGYVKIGRTNDVERRVRELDNGSIPLPQHIAPKGHEMTAQGIALGNKVKGT